MKSSVIILTRCIAICIAFFYHVELRSQSLVTYYSYSGSINNLSDIVFDAVGNIYANAGDKIVKITPQGVLTTVVTGNFWYRNLVVKNDGTVYYMDDSNWPFVVKKVTADGTISVVASGDINPQALVLDTNGNLYFVDQMNWPYRIIKVTPDGTNMILIEGQDIAPYNLTIDASGNIFFVDTYNWPSQIKKLATDGTLSTFVSGNYQPGNLTFDNAGNLFFIDEYNWPPEIKKVTGDGTVSTYLAGNYSPTCLSVDNNGNLYFTDQNNWPGQLLKISTDGTVSNNLSAGYYPESNYDLWSSYYSKNINFDSHGNIFFIDNNNSKIIELLNGPCFTPATPIVRDTSVCTASSITLTASAIGDVDWYDAPFGGNLIQSGPNLFLGPVTTNSMYYVEANYCNLTSPRVVINLTTLASPTASITGTTTGNDYVTLTAQGGATYLWSGGVDVTAATNVFTKSANYSATVYNAEGCTNVASALVVVNRMGVNRYGSITSNTAEQQDKNGKNGADTKVSKHGKISSTSPVDNMLNYTMYANNSAYAYNANDLDNLTSPAYQTSSGIDMANLLINWTNYGQLTAAGIAVPNGGERFSLVASGYFIPSESGMYTFSSEGDDAVDLFIEGINVVNHYGPHGTNAIGSHTGTITLQAGVKYTFRARMQENGGGEGLLVYWRKPSETSGWNIDENELSSY